MAHHSAQGGVWPGYVAALAGVAVSILLLIATLSLNIMQAAKTVGEISQLERERAAGSRMAASDTDSSASLASIRTGAGHDARASASADAQGSGASAQASASRDGQHAALTDASRTAAAPMAPGAIPSKGKAPQALTRSAPTARTASRPRVVLDFAQSGVTIPEADRAKVQEGLQQLSLGGDAQVLVCAYAPAGTAPQRTAYLRALSVRAMLIEGGRPANRISLRIVAAPRGSEVAISADDTDCKA